MVTNLVYYVHVDVAKRDFVERGIVTRWRTIRNIDVDALTNEQRDILWQVISMTDRTDAAHTKIYMPEIDVYDYESMRSIGSVDVELFDDIDADEWFAIAARTIRTNADNKKRFDDACAAHLSLKSEKFGVVSY